MSELVQLHFARANDNQLSGELGWGKGAMALLGYGHGICDRTRVSHQSPNRLKGRRRKGDGLGAAGATL